MDKLRTVVLDDVDIAVFLDSVSHFKEAAVRLRAAIGERRITERVARTNNIALHLDFRELASVTVAKAKHVSFTRSLCCTVQINRQIARGFTHFGTHTTHRRSTTRHDELFTACTSGHFQKSHRCTGIVHEHSARGIAPAKSHMNAGVATNQAFAHFFKIRKSSLDKRDIRISS